jgi:hypothetical protein
MSTRTSECVELRAWKTLRMQSTSSCAWHRWDLEGIVIVDLGVKYGTLTALNQHDEDAGTFFKLKQP